MYLFDPRKLAGIFVLPLMVGHAGLVLGAWYGAGLLIRKGLAGALIYVAGAVALLLLVIIGGVHRLGTAADYAGYDTKSAVSLFAVQLGWSFVVSLLAMFGSAVYVAIELGRDSRRVTAR